MPSAAIIQGAYLITTDYSAGQRSRYLAKSVITLLISLTLALEHTEAKPIARWEEHYAEVLGQELAHAVHIWATRRGRKWWTSWSYRPTINEDYNSRCAKGRFHLNCGSA